MSAWYVMSAMGFYAVAPGMPVTALGTPHFDRAAIHMPGGKRFTIRAPGASAGRFCIQSAKQMGSAPNRNWGAGAGDAPPSESRSAGTFSR